MMKTRLAVILSFLLVGTMLQGGSMAAVTLTGLQVNVTENPKVGDTVSVTATATNSGGTVYYRFNIIPNYGNSKYNPSSNYETMRDFSTSNTASYTFKEAGSYIVIAFASSTRSMQNGAAPIFGGYITVEEASASPAKSTSETKAESLLGSWYFGYSIGSSYFSDTYSLTYTNESFSDAGQYYAFGKDKWGDMVIAGYADTLGKYTLLDQGLLIDAWYTFSFSGNNTISGCYYQRNPNTGSLSRCYSLYGYRSSSSSMMGAIGPSELDNESVLIEMDQDGLIEYNDNPDPDLVDSFYDLKDLLDENN